MNYLPFETSKNYLSIRSRCEISCSALVFEIYGTIVLLTDGALEESRSDEQLSSLHCSWMLRNPILSLS